MNKELALIGRRIREERKAAKLSQAALAERINLSTQYISHIENGYKMPSLEVVLKVMKVLHIPPERMFADSGCRPEESLDAMTARCSSQSKRVIRDMVKILMESLKDNYEDTEAQK